MTQYDPAKGEENPFTNFVIVDNGYLEYYNRHLSDFESAMNAAGGAAFSPVTVLRIWGGAVNPAGDAEQAETAKKVADYGVALLRRNENFATDGQSVGSEKTRNRNVRTSRRKRHRRASAPQSQAAQRRRNVFVNHLKRLSRVACVRRQRRGVGYDCGHFFDGIHPRTRRPHLRGNVLGTHVKSHGRRARPRGQQHIAARCGVSRHRK